MAILENYGFEYPEEGVRNFWNLKATPMEIKEAVLEG